MAISDKKRWFPPKKSTAANVQRHCTSKRRSRARTCIWHFSILWNLELNQNSRDEFFSKYLWFTWRSHGWATAAYLPRLETYLDTNRQFVRSCKNEFDETNVRLNSKGTSRLFGKYLPQGSGQWIMVMSTKTHTSAKPHTHAHMGYVHVYFTKWRYMHVYDTHIYKYMCMCIYIPVCICKYVWVRADVTVCMYA